MELVSSPILEKKNDFSFDALDLGLIDYQEGLSVQQNIAFEIYSGRRKSALILCEHNPVITLGRSADKKNILKPEEELKNSGIGIYNVNRGGDVTLHLPGQLVVYPIFDLRLLGCDIHKFLRKLEEVIILLLQDYGILAGRKENHTGVWVNGRKIASIGIAIRHWISSHGLSLNVDCDLSLFSLIRPCGEDIIMTSMVRELNSGAISIVEIKKGIIDKFCDVLH